MADLAACITATIVDSASAAAAAAAAAVARRWCGRRCCHRCRSARSLRLVSFAIRVTVIG